MHNPKGTGSDPEDPHHGQDTEKLVQWRLKLSEFKPYIVHRAGVIHKAADVLSRPETKGEATERLDDEIPVLTVFGDVFACVAQMKINDVEFIENPRGPFVRFIPKICMRLSGPDNKTAEIQPLVEYITIQVSD